MQIKNKKEMTKEFKVRLYSFVINLINTLDTVPSNRLSNRIIDQLVRSSTSILGNYIEGTSSSSKKEYINYFQISLKSANESKVWLAILRDTHRLSKDVAEQFLSELDELSKIFASSVLTLKGK